MKSLGLFFSVILVTLGLAALLVYPVYVGLHAINPDWPFHKIASRLWLVLVVGAAIALGRHLQLKRASDWGYAISWRSFSQLLSLGFIAGVISMLPVALMLVHWGARPWANVPEARLLHLLWSGLLSGLAVGFMEETLFRGLLQGAVQKDFAARGKSPLVGIFCVAVLFAALHFLARISIPPTEVNPWSGLRLLAAVGDQFADFSRIADSFLALTVVGLLLGLIRAYFGNIAFAIGLHAGWVMVMRFIVGATNVPVTSPYHWLVSESDGFTGWLVFAWTASLLLALGLAWRLGVIARPPVR